MARVFLKFYTTLREKLGCEVEVSATTVKAAIEKAIGNRDDVRKMLFEKPSKIKGYFVITVNSEIVDNSAISKIKLRDGDIIHIFPPVSGG